MRVSMSALTGLASREGFYISLQLVLTMLVTIDCMEIARKPLKCKCCLTEAWPLSHPFPLLDITIINHQGRP